MQTLILRHVAQPQSTGAPCFQLIKPDGATIGPIEVKPAAGYPVDGRPNDDLMSELRWYLEDFLEYPFHPETEHAERVLKALQGWAAKAFDALFGSGERADLLARMTGDGADPLRLRIESTDPSVLSWPWEVMGREEEVPMGQRCRVERSLGSLETSPTSIAELPRDRVNILLVTARPKGERDVGFHSISRPMIDWIEKEKLPVDVHVLRPPTFERLSEHLQERPEHYHILHFDGHGAYRPTTTGNASELPLEGSSSFQMRTDAQRLKSYEGCLIFEDDIGGDRAIKASQLSSLLRQRGVPIVVLNACQSAMLDDAAETAFASVAASLIHAGTRSVVAMAYSLYVSAASEFLPAFYRGLFTSGSVAEGVRAGRRRLAEQRGRVCPRGRFDLEDWLVPVLYQQDDVDLPFAVEELPRDEASQPQLIDLGGEPPLNDFVGRDGEILQLERAFRSKPTAILVKGLGGVGKTTLARGFLEWLARTEGLGTGCLWLSFQEIRSAEYVWNRLGEELIGDQIAVLDPDKKIALLAETFRENRFVIVWDNFEVVAGISGTSAGPTFSETDRDQLQGFLADLRGGQTKVIITSRNDERWLGRERQIVTLPGLQGEDRWLYFQRILEDLDIQVDREDPNVKKLIDLLGGHPLTMRVLLPELARRQASELIEVLRSNLAALQLEDADAARLFATLKIAQDSLDPELRPLLVPLALHERFVDGRILAVMAQQTDPPLSQHAADTFLHSLTSAGLLQKTAHPWFEMHPALTGFLRITNPQRTKSADQDRWVQTFVNIFGRVADQLVQQPPDQGRAAFPWYRPNFLVAAEAAERFNLLIAGSALRQALGKFAQDQGLVLEATEHFRKLALLNHKHGHKYGESSAYHQLGILAEERRKLDAAEGWYRKSLQISTELGIEIDIATTYHQLGSLARKRHRFDDAANWCRKSLKISEKLGNEPGMAHNYHLLGVIECQRRNFATAEVWCQKAVRVSQRLNDQDRMASHYHLLGQIARERRDLKAAETWFHKASSADEAGDDTTYLHQLAVIAEERHDFEAAESCCRKTLQVHERLGNDYGAAMIYNQMSRIALKRHDLETAESWSMKAQEIFERLHDTQGVINTYHVLSIITSKRGDFGTAESWCQMALKASEPNGDDYHAVIFQAHLGWIAQTRGDLDTAEHRYHQVLRIFEELDYKHGTATLYNNLGAIAHECGNFEKALSWLLRALRIREELGDDFDIAITCNNLGRLAYDRRNHEEAGDWYIRSLITFVELNDIQNMANTGNNFITCYQEATTASKAKLRSLWETSGLPHSEIFPTE